MKLKINGRIGIVCNKCHKHINKSYDDEPTYTQEDYNKYRFEKIVRIVTREGCVIETYHQNCYDTVIRTKGGE